MEENILVRDETTKICKMIEEQSNTTVDFNYDYESVDSKNDE